MLTAAGWTVEIAFDVSLLRILNSSLKERVLGRYSMVQRAVPSRSPRFLGGLLNVHEEEKSVAMQRLGISLFSMDVGFLSSDNAVCPLSVP